MIQEKDFKWKIRYANNIPNNPVQCEFCIIDLGNGKSKLYMIEPHYPQNTDGLTDQTGGHRYFVFFDCDARLPNEEEQKIDFFDWITYGGYILTSKTLIAIFDTMDDAKKRAYAQYKHHFRYVLSHFVDDIEAETQKHSVVQ